MMRPFQFAAIWALVVCANGQSIVGATHIAFRARDAVLLDGHDPPFAVRRSAQAPKAPGADRSKSAKPFQNPKSAHPYLYSLGTQLFFRGRIAQLYGAAGT